MNTNHPSVAIVGATGAVGGELIACLQDRNFPLRSLRLFASPRSAGRSLRFRSEALPVEVLNEASLANIDIALFSAGSETSRRIAPRAAAQGTIVVDNSSAFRMQPEVPLVVPEVNAPEIARHAGIIANPNCVAIIAAMPLWPLHQAFTLRRVIAATYQAVSGAGAAAMEELRQSTVDYLAGQVRAPKVLRHPSAFNLFSHDTAIDPATGSNGEETKVMQELRKIMQAPDLRIGITCVRVPVLRAHSMALTIELYRPVKLDEIRQVLARAPGIRLVDHAPQNHFPMPNEASGQGDVLVGRIRYDASDPSGRSVSIFIAGDQLLKGAALNAVQIAERLLN